MRPLAYALQFRGVIAPVATDAFSARASAPSGSLRTILEPDGVHASYEQEDGDEAVLEARFDVGTDGSLRCSGSVTFGVQHSVRFRTLDDGRLDVTPDRHLRQGSLTAAIEGGTGQFADARGRIASTFLWSDTGELTEHQLGVVFVHEGDEGWHEATTQGGRNG